MFIAFGVVAAFQFETRGESKIMSFKKCFRKCFPSLLHYRFDLSECNASYEQIIHLLDMQQAPMKNKCLDKDCTCNRISPKSPSAKTSKSIFSNHIFSEKPKNMLFVIDIADPFLSLLRPEKTIIYYLSLTFFGNPIRGFLFA